MYLSSRAQWSSLPITLLHLYLCGSWEILCCVGNASQSHNYITPIPSSLHMTGITCRRGQLFLHNSTWNCKFLLLLLLMNVNLSSRSCLPPSLPLSFLPSSFSFLLCHFQSLFPLLFRVTLRFQNTAHETKSQIWKYIFTTCFHVLPPELGRQGGIS